MPGPSSNPGGKASSTANKQNKRAKLDPDRQGASGNVKIEPPSNSEQQMVSQPANLANSTNRPPPANYAANFVGSTATPTSPSPSVPDPNWDGWNQGPNPADALSTVSTMSSINKCACKKSRCLKMYCVCFARGALCDACPCENCHNNDRLDGGARQVRMIFCIDLCVKSYESLRHAASCAIVEISQKMREWHLQIFCPYHPHLCLQVRDQALKKEAPWRKVSTNIY